MVGKQIDQLPPEVLNIICHDLSISTLKDLRLVSPNWNRVAEPRLFDTICLRVDPDSFKLPRNFAHRLKPEKPLKKTANLRRSAKLERRAVLKTCRNLKTRANLKRRTTSGITADPEEVRREEIRQCVKTIHLDGRMLCDPDDRPGFSEWVEEYAARGSGFPSDDETRLKFLDQFREKELEEYHVAYIEWLIEQRRFMKANCMGGQLVETMRNLSRLTTLGYSVEDPPDVAAAAAASVSPCLAPGSVIPLSQVAKQILHEPGKPRKLGADHFWILLGAAIESGRSKQLQRVYGRGIEKPYEQVPKILHATDTRLDGAFSSLQSLDLQFSSTDHALFNKDMTNLITRMTFDSETSSLSWLRISKANWPLHEVISIGTHWVHLRHLCLEGIGVIQTYLHRFLHNHAETLTSLHLSDLTLLTSWGDDFGKASWIKLFGFLHHKLMLKKVCLNGRLKTDKNTVIYEAFSSDPYDARRARSPGAKDNDAQIEVICTEDNLYPGTHQYVLNKPGLWPSYLRRSMLRSLGWRYVAEEEREGKDDPAPGAQLQTRADSPAPQSKAFPQDCLKYRIERYLTRQADVFPFDFGELPGSNFLWLFEEDESWRRYEPEDWHLSLEEESGSLGCNLPWAEKYAWWRRAYPSWSGPKPGPVSDLWQRSWLESSENNWSSDSRTKALDIFLDWATPQNLTT